MGTTVARWLGLTGIYTARTGTPFTVFDCTDQLSGETACPRVFQTAALPTGARSNPPEIAGSENRFNYLDLTGRIQAGGYVNARTGTPDIGTFPSKYDRA